ncbi:MAG: DedA family protein [Chloroflexi bacterium]|nr:DedA family protein [Chloroflexota bacterium]MBV9544939.1 DedA family protein [Chloroflexota bacterium]
MTWWDEVSLSIQYFLDHNGVITAFVLILIEETGVPVPVPGDFLMLAMGVHAREGRIPLWQALLTMEGATLLGATVLYFLSARAGRNLVFRYGKYMHLTQERLDRAERWLSKHGMAAIVVGRVTPGLRIATVIACGVFGVPFWQFLPGLALGALLYILIYTMAGYIFGPAILSVVEGIHLPLGLLGSLIPLVIIIAWVWRTRRGLSLARHTEAGGLDQRHRWRDGAVAGGVATVISTLTLNVLVHVMGDVAFLAPGDVLTYAQARLALLAVVRVLGPILLLAVTPAFMLVGVAWGAVYAQWVEPHLHFPDWLAGMAFALLPLGVALVFVLPMLDGAAPQLGRLGPLAGFSEAVRHMVFGASLGLVYPLRLARFPRRSRAEQPGVLAAAHPSSA